MSEIIHGKTIVDEYRFMENMKDSSVLNWYKEQTFFKKKTINKIPNRNELKKSLINTFNTNVSLISYQRITNNDKIFYLKNNDKTNNKELFFRNSIDHEEKLLFNPNQYLQEAIINYISPSWDGNYVAISVTLNDSEIGDILIFDVVKNVLKKEVIKNCWPSALGGIRWLSDSKSFTYEYIPIIDKTDKNYLHNIETRIHLLDKSVNTDRVIFSKKNNPEIDIKEEDFPEVSSKKQHSKYLFSNVSGASYYADYYYAPAKNINSKKIKWTKLFKREDLVKKFYVNTNDEIIFLTAKNAKNFKICKTPISNPDFTSPEVLVKEDKNSVITDFTLTSDGVFFVKTKNGIDAKLYQLNNNNETLYIETPKKAGYINVYSKNPTNSDLFIDIRGWTSNKETYKLNHQTYTFNKLELIKLTELTSNIIIEEVEIESHDGTKVPLSLIYKKGIKLNTKNRVLMTGYGAFGISSKPRVNRYLLSWINTGGIYAVAHVRGGGEKGDNWHKSGYKITKPNTWKDFIACAEYLIEKKYTSSEKLAAYGASGGGILIGRAITERPDLFSAAIVRVGVFNTLRSEFAPNGKNLAKEFGSIKDSLEFQGLLEMDAYHKVKNNVEYPAILLTGGITDSRVPVWHQGKFAAKLQNASISNKPILLSIDFKGGHGLSQKNDKKINEITNIISFALWQTGHPDYQLK